MCSSLNQQSCVSVSKQQSTQHMEMLELCVQDISLRMTEEEETATVMMMMTMFDEELQMINRHPTGKLPCKFIFALLCHRTHHASSAPVMTQRNSSQNSGSMPRC